MQQVSENQPCFFVCIYIFLLVSTCTITIMFFSFVMVLYENTMTIMYIVRVL